MKLLLLLVTSLAWADTPIDPYRELVIVDPFVVEDVRANAGGPWHFSSLLKQMLPSEATDEDLGRFMRQWLSDSKSITELNGFSLLFPGFALGERTICRWLDPTLRGPCAVGQVNPSTIPYRLLAIVNRIDLHQRAGDVAEGRFVFGALTRPTDKPATDPPPAFPETVIFEYALPLTSPADLKDWARKWHRLSELSCDTREGCEPYRRELEILTKSFSSRGLVPSKVNGNPLAQIRTSHLATGSSSTWSFRQFELRGEGATTTLVTTPTSQTPHHGLDGHAKLADAVQANAESIVKETFVWGKEWLGGESLIDESKSHPWQLEGVDEELRRQFSIQTCSGCHSERNVLDGFFHVSPVAAAGNTGKDRLSSYVMDEEIPKRSGLMKRLLTE